MASDALKIVTQDDVEQAKRPAGRAGFLPAGEPVDPSKLMEVLGDIESLKREIQDRMRRIEAVKQAKTLLMEDALRTEALNKRLAEIGKVMSAVHSGFLNEETELDGADVLRMQSRELAPVAEPRPAPVLVLHEGVALAWPKAEETVRAEVQAPDAVEELGSALTIAEADTVSLEAIAAEAESLQVATLEALPPASLEETASLEIAQSLEQMLEMTPLVTQESVEVAFEATPEQHSEFLAECAGEASLEAIAEPEPGVFEVPMGTADALAVAEQAETIEPMGMTLSRAEELILEARRLLEESAIRLDLATEREENATADLQTTRDTMVAAYQSAADRLAAAEDRWKVADGAALEAKRLFEESTAQLTLAVTKEQQSSADFHAAQQALTAAYQSACQRLEAAEQFSKTGEGFAQETRKLLERMEQELAAAKSGAHLAAEDLQSARQELTTAYQFASVAAQRRLDGAEFFRKTASWVVYSTALAWICAVWMAWAAFHQAVPLAIPFCASCLLLAGAVFVKKRGARELEEA